MTHVIKAPFNCLNSSRPPPICATSKALSIKPTGDMLQGVGFISVGQTESSQAVIRHRLQPVSLMPHTTASHNRPCLAVFSQEILLFI